MPDSTRKAVAAGGLAIAGLLAAAILAQPAPMLAGPERVTSSHSSQGSSTMIRKHDRHGASVSAQASSSATSSAGAPANAKASATARSSATAGPGASEMDCAADAMASAETDGERITVRDSRRYRDAQGGCHAEANAVAGEKRKDGD